MTDITCDVCGGPNGMFVLNEQNVCRWCHPPFPQEHRPALNALRKGGLI